MVYVEQFLMAGVQIGAYLRVYAAWPFTVFAGFCVASVHAVHVGRRSSQIAEVSLEVGHLTYLSHLFENALLGAAYHKLALMGRDGAEGTATETSPVYVYRVFYHLVGRNGLSLVFGMGQARVGEVEGSVELLSGHGGVWGIDDDD